MAKVYDLTITRIFELSLRSIIHEYLADRTGEYAESWTRLLPCGTDQMVFPESYRDMLDHIKEIERSGGYGYRPDGGRETSECRDHRRKGVIVSGNPGIGNPWFQSAILVDRLLDGIPTVLQVDDEHLLFDEQGVRLLSELGRSDPVYNKTRVWALVGQRVCGAG